MNALTIAGVAVRQDAEGRFSLNDLHRAAGGEKRHAPNYWLTNQQTRELIDEMSDTGNPVSAQRGGAEQGTFVAKELVYAYAMWISAAFHLKVIRAYDALVTGQGNPMAVLNDPAALRNLLIGYTEKVQQLEHVVQEQAPKVEALDRLAGLHGAISLTEAAKLLQMRRSDLFGWMQSHSWIYKRPGSAWLPYQPRIQQGVLVLKAIQLGEERIGEQTLVTPKGLARLGELLAKERTAA